ncbi:hypothetical protein SSX86_019569 [Deinandra increscens subsp. villosa]|uniref:DNA damage-binding protein 1 n=1 Tax=Deinandra increscens subsp. villosa TaxID=3103831 RepID=A0AAP0GT57_9ASTR
MAVSEEESSSASGNNSRPPLSHGGPHYLAKCVLKGSVVLQVVYGHIRSPSSLDIVFGKETSLELAMIDDHGVLQSICEQPIFGTIKDIAVLPWNNRFRRAIPQLHGKDLLLVTSDSGNLSVLSFHNEMHSGCYIASSAYEDHLALFKVSSSTSADIIDKKIFCPPDNEKNTSTSMGVSGIHGTIWSMCFISKDMSQLSEEHDPLLAILLNRKGSLLNELLLLEWNTKDNFVHVLSQYAELGPLALDIVEVPYSYGYAFLFRVSDALLMDLRDPHNPVCVYRTSLNFLPSVIDDHIFIEESYRTNDVDEEGNICNVAASALLELKDIIKDDDPMNIDDDNGYSSKSTSNRVCSWCWEPENFVNPRMIFCVDTGELFMIEIYSESNGLKVNLSDCLYKGSPFKELLWAENGFLTALAEMGDGMVLGFEDGKLNYKSPIQNISPILDTALVDYHDEKHEQIFACCGMAPEGSLRVIRNGVTLEKLLKTSPDYQGITGTWAVKMKLTDCYHSFLVLSFVEETRVLSVGVSFTDVTDSVGFRPDVCTLACGVISDGLLVQIHQTAVRLSVPTAAAHSEGIPFPSPNYTTWSPDNSAISMGAIGNSFIVVATSNPCYLFILGVRQLVGYRYEVYQMQNVGLEYELSCISIPQKLVQEDLSNYPVNYNKVEPTHGVKIGNTFVIGTHRPSVEVISFKPGHDIKALAVGVISLVNSSGTTISGSIPQDVRLVKSDRLYILSGLRNGMLLRFEWPLPYDLDSVDSIHSSVVSEMADDSCVVNLELISIRRIGITPAFLIPLNDLMDADIIALSDRPWLLQTARHSISLTSISFQASTHATPMEMVRSKRLNVQKFHLGGTPRKVLYHAESRLLLVLRTDLSDESCSSDICCVDPMSGSVISSFKLDLGETGKCMELSKAGSEQVLVVGTSLSSGPAIMASGEAESTRGRLIVLCLEHKQNSDSGSMTFYSKGGSSSQRTSPFREISGYGTDSLCSSPDDNSCDETEAWNLRLAYSTNMRGIVLAICPYLDCYFLASAGNAFYVCSFQNDNSLRVKRLAVGRTRFMIMTLTTHFTTIAVGDCRDGVLFYSYNEDAKKVEQLYSDPVQRLVADCLLMNTDTAIVSDRMGSIAILSSSHHSGDNASPERNLKGSFSYKLLADDEMRDCDIASSIMDLSNSSIVASTLLGSIIILIPISRFFGLCHTQLSLYTGNLRNHIGRMLTVDSNGCYIASSAYEDHLALFKVSSSTSADIIDKKIFCPPDNEKNTSTSMGVSGIHGTIWSMCFISKDMSQLSEEHDPLLAILLNRKGSLLNELLLLEWNTKDNFVHVLSQYAELGPLALDIVEVPYSYGYAFLFRVSDALLMDLRDPHNPVCVYRTSLNFLPSVIDDHIFIEESYRTNDVDEEGNICNVAASALLELKDIIKDDDPMNIDDDNGYSSKSTSNRVCSWCWEPENFVNPRMIFCVDTGELFMIEIYSESNGLKVNLSDCLYKGSPFKELLWAENGFLTALAEMGDGMVLGFEDGKLTYKSPIQNISPILDTALVDYHDEKHEQIFACCGMAPEGSLRVIRNGVTLEKLLKTSPDYQGITGTWAVKMKLTDCYHSFLVLSFVEETRVLSVGVSFTDVTDSVGFRPDVCTLACGVISDGLLVQIHQTAVRLSVPTAAAHSDGIPFPSPNYTTWSPDNSAISMGAIGNSFIVVATSNPCYLFILGVRQLVGYRYEVYQMQNVGLEYELSCISIPQKLVQEDLSNYPVNYNKVEPTHGVKIGNTFVIGTHRPSVEVISFKPGHDIKALAVGVISLVNSSGTTISGSIPQDVRLVKSDRLYILSGLRNGMLLRFEWPLPYDLDSVDSMHSSVVSEMADDSCVVNLELISIRRIGITPAFLIPLNDLMDADIIALSDRPWLLQTARHSISLTSISFQASTHATPVCSSECPNGILLVSENSLHLMEMVRSKRLNVQKFHLGGTPRKVLYHAESRLLLVLRTDLSDESCSSDICCVDPMSGSVISSFKLDLGETGKCMELSKAGSEQVLVVGTSLSSGPAIMASGEAESTRGRLIVLCLEHKQNSDSGSMTFYSKGGSSSQRTSPFREISGYGTDSLCSSPDDNSCDETEAWNLRLAYSTNMRGIVLAICPYLDCYFLASAGNAFYVCSFQNDNSLRVKRLAVGRTRFMIMTLTTHFTTIAVGDCRDGVLFYSYNEDAKKVEQLYSDPVQRLVADCLLMNTDTAIVSDRMGSIAILSSSHHSGDNASPERNLKVCSSFYTGEIVMSIRKGSFSYKLLADDEMRDCDIASSIMDLSNSSIVASTLLGSIIILIPISRDEYELLEDVQSRIADHSLTAPILRNCHEEFRSRESPAGAGKILDGDMLGQFLELTNVQQENILHVPENPLYKYIPKDRRKPQLPKLNVTKVVRLLERLHGALN